MSMTGALRPWKRITEETSVEKVKMTENSQISGGRVAADLSALTKVRRRHKSGIEQFESAIEEVYLGQEGADGERQQEVGEPLLELVVLQVKISAKPPLASRMHYAPL